MNEQDLHALCLQYGQWCRTRRFFAPPLPRSLLAQFQPRTGAGVEPDADLVPEMQFFNMAVHALADDHPEDAACFTLYYFHDVRPVKKIASAMGISRQAVYKRLHAHAARIEKARHLIKRVHTGQSVNL
ncbi:hypothetical protein PBR20603_04396 [Pandoraea bronchicola]|uniref:Uncharacterized protein n=2 Tax=Pandoraea bronchicola TaxID=2508287 RepID=A0A5E5BZ75_9BURK|nr:hypothetical protein PBR20603_04396 [Pandoraea bronchicola]